MNKHNQLECGKDNWFYSPPHAVAPPEEGAGAGATTAAAPPEEKSGWRSKRSLDGLEVLKGK